MHCLSCDCNFSEARELESRCLLLMEELSQQNTEMPNLAVIYARLAALNDILCNYLVAKKWALKALECVSLQLPVKSIVFVFGQASKSCIVAKRFKKSEAIARGSVNIARYPVLFLVTLVSAVVPVASTAGPVTPCTQTLSCTWATATSP